MTTETRVSDVLHGLVVQWRHNAQGCSNHEAHAAGTWRSCARDLSAALPLLEGGKGEPDGDYVLVPRVPTQAMLYALYSPAFERFEDAYAKMIAAAPQPAAQQQDRSQWSLFDRAEFALRDGGFDLDDAHRYAHAIRNAEQQPAGDVDLLVQARELLAAEFDRAGRADSVRNTRSGMFDELIAMRAIIAALRANAGGK